jgi:rubrerythrin
MSTRDEAVAAAKQLEVDGRKYYLEKAESVSSESVKATFLSLADDEAKHLAWLDTLEPDITSAAAANKALYGKLEKIFAGGESQVAGEGASSDIEVIDVAIGMEEKSLAAYRVWVDSGESEDIRTLGGVLCGVESFHRELLENVKAYLQSPGDWFQQEEKWNFEGG